MASKFIKKTTGLTGISVAKDPHNSLKILYGKILSTIEHMPSSAAYRKHTENVVKRRLDLVNQEQNVLKLEEKINCGQIEEVIRQAENELLLARKMITWKPWEPLVSAAPHNQWKWPV
jgi:NADH dehydrogenase (ubiquinone) 1 alpha subcomplex subunit 5